MIRRSQHKSCRWLVTLAGLVVGVALAQDAPPAPAPQPAAATAPPPAAAATVRVVLHTALGNIALALEKDRAPITVNNFLRYVDQKRFDGSNFYRAMKIGDEGKYGLIQGGLQGNPRLVFKPIAHEPTSLTGLSHVDGAISMARAEPGTATADFFIVIGDLVSLDAQPNGGDPGYAVFGHVVEGMDVVKSILDQPTSAEAAEAVMRGQMLTRPVKIILVRRE
jgi:peptidyl-prolyl cis-trans isomerase A (cyclophilin A)